MKKWSFPIFHSVAHSIVSLRPEEIREKFPFTGYTLLSEFTVVFGRATPHSFQN